MSEIEESVIDRIRSRRDVGRAKYGVTMERTDLSTAQWMRHAQEEALDLAIYLAKLEQIETAKLPTSKDVQDVYEITSLRAQNHAITEALRKAKVSLENARDFVPVTKWIDDTLAHINKVLDTPTPKT